LTVGPNVNMSEVLGNQNEATLAINPTNPNNLVGFSNDEAASGGVRIYVSNDGGQNWTTRIFGFNHDGEVSACCDTQAAFDDFGNLFVVNVENSLAVRLLLSTDGGKTFKRLVTFNGFNDQPSVATGAGQVWISFTDSSGTITAAGARVTGLGKVGAFVHEVAPNATGDFGNVAIGPSGQVMITYMNPPGGAGPATLYGNLDPDGVGLGHMGPRFKITGTNVGGFDPIPAQPNRTVDAEPNLVYDRSGGTHNGRVYLVYTDAPAVGNKDLNNFVRFSDDNGKTWSAPVRVNDDTTKNSQFLPQIAVDQSTGNVAVAWYDARNAGKANTTAQIFATVSTDGGATFLPNVQVSSGTSNVTKANSGIDYGDFFTMEYRNNVFYPVWSDNSNSTKDNPNGTLHALDIYTAKVTFSAGGVPPDSIVGGPRLLRPSNPHRPLRGNLGSDANLGGAESATVPADVAAVLFLTQAPTSQESESRPELPDASAGGWQEMSSHTLVLDGHLLPGVEHGALPSAGRRLAAWWAKQGAVAVAGVGDGLEKIC
jgi:hypothetical protein